MLRRRGAGILGAFVFSIAIWMALVCSVLAATGSEQRLMERINQAVNRELSFQPDEEQYGRDVIAVEPSSKRGDCDDYVFTKLARLFQAGFPGERMAVLRVTNEKGAPHAVLIVDGDWVLDNRFAWIEHKATLERYGYRFPL